MLEQGGTDPIPAEGFAQGCSEYIKTLIAISQKTELSEYEQQYLPYLVETIRQYALLWLSEDNTRLPDLSTDKSSDSNGLVDQFPQNARSFANAAERVFEHFERQGTDAAPQRLQDERYPLDSLLKSRDPYVQLLAGLQGVSRYDLAEEDHRDLRSPYEDIAISLLGVMGALAFHNGGAPRRLGGTTDDLKNLEYCLNQMKRKSVETTQQ
jgi:hypothetical protein